MTFHKHRAVGVKRILLLTGLTVLIVPADAFGCWDLCVSTTGYYRDMYGSTWELDHCVQSWPDGSNSPKTTCYYRRLQY